MSSCPRIAAALLVILGLFAEVSAQQNTPQIKKPATNDQYTPPETGPSNGDTPIVEDECLKTAKDTGALARLKKRALASVKENGGDTQAFVSNIPDGTLAQCRYYTNVIDSYQ